ncbi:MAG: Arm DNA-binding domain-containing protein, partial [Candidatus Obscuribacterales bacterium]|nr:Arm DNA-binding domain-containing protein [Candidatus Obscuribacterales bacterium]
MPSINTDFVTKTATPGDYRDSRLLGFLLRISKTGTKSYQVQGRIKGAGIIRHTIGKHGAPWTPKFAREEAERVLRLMKTGIDPRNEKRERQEQQQAKISQDRADQLRTKLTLRKVFEDWEKDERKDKKSTKDLYKQVLHKHLSDWLDLPLCEITTDMVSKRYNEVADRTVASANNTFRALRRLYNWVILEHETASGEPIISFNPVEVLSKRNKWRTLSSRDDLIADEDLKAWFNAVITLDND